MLPGKIVGGYRRRRNPNEDHRALWHVMSRSSQFALARFVLILVFQAMCTASCADPSAEADFRMSCSACHGDDGRGEGAKAFGLTTEPPDLTLLRRRNGGILPRERLRRIIDGREDIKIHGDREMPVWGQLFKSDAEEGLGGAEADDASVA